MIRNGIDADQVAGCIQLLRTSPEAGKVSSKSHHRWQTGYAVEWRAEEIDLAGAVLPRGHTVHADGDVPGRRLACETGTAGAVGPAALIYR